jgi:hypothetical protein
MTVEVSGFADHLHGYFLAFLEPLQHQNIR